MDHYGTARRYPNLRIRVVGHAGFPSVNKSPRRSLLPSCRRSLDASAISGGNHADAQLEGKAMTTNIDNHDDLEIPAILRRKPKTPQLAPLPGMTPLGKKPVMLATEQGDAGLVPAKKASVEAAKLAAATGEMVSVRDPI